MTRTSRLQDGIDSEDSRRDFLTWRKLQAATDTSLYPCRSREPGTDSGASGSIRKSCYWMFPISFSLDWSDTSFQLQVSNLMAFPVLSNSSDLDKVKGTRVKNIKVAYLLALCFAWDFLHHLLRKDKPHLSPRRRPLTSTSLHSWKFDEVSNAMSVGKADTTAASQRDV